MMRLIAACLLGICCLFGSAKADTSSPATEQGQSQDAKDVLDVLQMLKRALGDMQSIVDGLMEAPGLVKEGLKVVEAIDTETSKLLAAEVECAKGDTEACQKRLRQRCPELAASYAAIKERVDSFDKQVAASKLSANAKEFFSMLSASLVEAIGTLKEQLMGLSCIEA